MEQYIKKSALVAKVEELSAYLDSFHEQRIIEKILSIIDTLEVKEVEEPNAADRGTAEEIIINLKRVEKDYRIDLTREIEWLRNKVKKGD